MYRLHLCPMFLWGPVRSRGNPLLNARMGSVLLFRVDQIGSITLRRSWRCPFLDILGSFGDKRAEKILTLFLIWGWMLLNANSSNLRAYISETSRHGAIFITSCEQGKTGEYVLAHKIELIVHFSQTQ